MNMSTPNRLAYYPTFFSTLLRASDMNNATILHEDNYTASCILFPPGKDPSNPWTMVPAGILGIAWNVGLRGLVRQTHEIPSQVTKFKKQTIPDGKFYYIFMIATHSDGRGKGMGGRLIREAQRRAQADNMPIWLESSTTGSKRLYEREGFRAVGEIVIGKNIVGADGEAKKDGEGVTMWPMVWWPEKAAEQQ